MCYKVGRGEDTNLTEKDPMRSYLSVVTLAIALAAPAAQAQAQAKNWLLMSVDERFDWAERQARLVVCRGGKVVPKEGEPDAKSYRTDAWVRMKMAAVPFESLVLKGIKERCQPATAAKAR